MARRGHPLRRRAGKPHADALARGAEMLAHAQAHAQHHAARAERVARDPIDEAAQFLLERRDVELLLDLLHAVVESRIGIEILGPYHGGRLARPKGDAHEIAGCELHAVGHPVGIGLVEGDRDQYIDDAPRHGPIRCA